MKNDSIALITKDDCPCNLLPVYGNSFFSMPNLEELTAKGTIFTRHHTGAPSTWMSYICMFTGLFCHELDIESAIHISEKYFEGHTLFDKARDRGYECHVFWDESWDSSFKMRNHYINYGKGTIFHTAHVKQPVGAHYIHEGDYIRRSENKTDEAIKRIKEALEEVADSNERVFFWAHIPHLLDGYTAWGEDIEAFDRIIGLVRKHFSDDRIFVSSDHGNMCGAKGKYGYGYHVYEPVARIPLITPKIGNDDKVDRLTSNIDLFSIIFDRNIPMREFIYCDSQLRAQPVRKLAIYKDNYKYIFNKSSGMEEMYDLFLDPNEDRNIIDEYYYDPDRCVTSHLREMYYYPHWDVAEKMRDVFRNEKKRIWSDGSKHIEILLKAEYFVNMHGLKKWKRRVRKTPIVK